MKIKELEINKNVTKNDFVNAGFLITTKNYLYKRNLYDKKIYFYLYVSREDNSIQKVSVWDEYLQQDYIPFYNRKNCTNNKVLNIVEQKLNLILDELVKKGVAYV